MGIWNRIFGRSSDELMLHPTLFGRFSDAHKSAEQYKHFDQANRMFEAGSYRAATIHFLEYLKNDDGENVSFNAHDRNTSFELVQGSKKIYGHFEDDRLIARSQVVEGETFSTGLLRKLLEKNYELNYCRFALDESNQLFVVFESFVKDANPYKLYYGLKELSIQADKMDDLILTEFSNFQPRTQSLSKPISPDLAKVKSTFFYIQLSVLKEKLDNGFLARARDPNIIICAILGAFYKLDYLLTPHGRSTDIIEHAHKEFFADSTRPVELKVSELFEALEELQSISESDLNREWYQVLYTFGINAPIDLHQAQNYMQSDISQIDWYLENNQFDEAQVKTEFIIGYTLFNYSVDRLLQSLLTLYYRISHIEYFSDLGVKSQFIDKKGNLNRGKILSEVKELIDRYEDDYHAINIPTELLNFQTIYHFGHSLLKMILSSQFVEIEGRQ